MGNAINLFPAPQGDILNASVGSFDNGTGTVGQFAGLTIVPNVGTPQLLMSLTTVGSGATGTATGTAYSGLKVFRQADVIVNVTAVVGAATNSLIIFVDSQVDGTSWVNVAQFPVSTVASNFVAHFTRGTANAITDVTADAGAGTIRAVGLGDTVRIRRQITGTATTSFSASIYITNMIG